MELTLRLTIGFLIVSSTMDYTFMKPIMKRDKIFNEKLSNSNGISGGDLNIRNIRQVVQPKWLQGPPPQSKISDSHVEVNQKNLNEAAAIRGMIQDAVDNDRFAVSMSSEPKKSFKADTGSDTTIQHVDRNNFQLFGPSDNIQDEMNNFWDELRQMWSDISENYIQYLVKEIMGISTALNHDIM